MVRLSGGLYVIRCAGHITIIKAVLQSATCSYFCYSTLRRLWLVSVATPPRLTYSVHRDRLDNHGTSQPLRWCRQSEPFIFIRPGSANNNFLRPAAFAQRTGKALCRGLTQTAPMPGPCIWCHRPPHAARSGVCALPA
nr:MAG TPA: hypothetical protein [Caudoviricetes sp.]